MSELTAAFPESRPRAVPIGAHQSGKPSLNLQIDEQGILRQTQCGSLQMEKACVREWRKP
jgi:hypothetical protein